MNLLFLRLTKYYYLVVEYPNIDDDQADTDANGGKITASLKVTDGSVKVDKGTTALKRPGVD